MIQQVFCNNMKNKTNFLIRHRLKNGMCINCGNQTHSAKGTGPFRKYKPLSTPHASNGICLKCNPINNSVNYGTKNVTGDDSSLEETVMPLPFNPQGQLISQESKDLTQVIIDSQNTFHMDSNLLNESNSLDMKNETKLLPSAPSLTYRRGKDFLLTVQNENITLDRNRCKTLWKNAQKMHLLGRNNGLSGGKLEKAIAAFSKAEESMALLTSMSHSDKDNAYSEFRIQVLIDLANLYMTMQRFEQAKEILINAVKFHEQTFTAENMQHHTISSTLLLVNIFRLLFIIDYGFDDKVSCDTILKRGVMMLRKVQNIDANNEKMLCLLSAFLAFVSVQEKDIPKKISSASQSIKIIETLSKQYSKNNDYAFQMVQSLRLASLSYRSGNLFEKASATITQAINIINNLIKSNPKAPSFIFEKHRCYSALVSHLKFSLKPGEKVNDVLSALTNEASSITQFLKFVPSAVKCWDRLTMIYIDTAQLQEQMRNKTAALETLNLALDSAERSVQLPHESSFEFYFNFTRALAENGRILFDMKRYKAAIPFYVRVEDIFSNHIVDHEKAKDDEFYYEQFSHIMITAYRCATEMNDKSHSFFFVTKAIEIGEMMDTRKGKIYLTKNMNNLGDFHLERKEYKKAIDMYRESLKIITPLFTKYRWHFFLGLNFCSVHRGLAKAFKAVNDDFSESYHRRELLNYQADLHGIIELSGSQNDSIIQLREKCNHIPVTKSFKLKNSGHSVYILPSIPGKNPLEDQARALEEDYGVKIPDNVKEYCNKMSDQSVDNKTCLQGLSQVSIFNHDRATHT